MATAFEQTTNYKNLGGQVNGGLNANSLINVKGPKTNKEGLSFAQELTRQRDSVGQARADFDPMQNLVANQESSSHGKIKKNIQDNVASMINGTIANEAEAKLKSIRNEETFKEIRNEQNTEEVFADSEELANKYTQSETIKAAVMQENQKTVTNAVKEGNVAQQEARHYEDGNSRKKQLANWEEFTPRITEDTLNKAVRIDIPGLADLQTLIVRMKQGSVTIQAVGSRDTMERLKASQPQIAGKLQEKNVKLATLQVFDSSAVKKKPSFQS